MSPAQAPVKRTDGGDDRVCRPPPLTPRLLPLSPSASLHHSGAPAHADQRTALCTFVRMGRSHCLRTCTLPPR